ncbi:hypothetical protein [Microbacterium sp. NPDC096154]|uniref:hypothetical protein n=1 Tax=Microbacterium sp. NPDC096154 TaxID=3155549 RepID=UPI0033215E31
MLTLPPDVRDAGRAFFEYLGGPEFQPVVITAGWIALAAVMGLIMFFVLRGILNGIARLISRISYTLRRTIDERGRARERARYHRTPAAPAASAARATSPESLEQPSRFFQGRPTGHKISRAGWYDREPGPRDWSPPPSNWQDPTRD